MSGFRDMHSHFIYGMDDGAQTARDMEAMLDAAHADGIAFLFATPHMTPGVAPFDDALFARRLEEARGYCANRGYGITLHRGAEILCTPALSSWALDRRLPTLGDSHAVLLEFAPQVAFRDLADTAALVWRCGYQVILAHVERYRCLYQGRNALTLKQACPVRYQVNGGTVIHGINLWRDHVLDRWFRAGLIDLVATDSHSCHHRATNMTEVYAVLARRYGSAYADRLTRPGASPILSAAEEHHSSTESEEPV